MQVKKQQLELDMEQQTDSRLEKEYIKAVYSRPVILKPFEREILLYYWNCVFIPLYY